MLTYEKDIVPVKISAREAHNGATNETYLELLKSTYQHIRLAIKEGDTNIEHWFHDFEMADKVFHELVVQGYNISMHKIDGAWCLAIDWEDIDLDPNTKYILPMEENEFLNYYNDTVRSYAYKRTDGYWSTTAESSPDHAITVTAKELEEAPEWVKAIEPVEVKD